jgi:hypothetical protein
MPLKLPLHALVQVMQAPARRKVKDYLAIAFIGAKVPATDAL